MDDFIHVMTHIPQYIPYLKWGKIYDVYVHILDPIYPKCEFHTELQYVCIIPNNICFHPNIV